MPYYPFLKTDDNEVHFKSRSDKNNWPVFDIETHWSELSKMKSLLLIGHSKTIPESLGRLTQLTHLSIGGDLLISLPKSLGLLTQLRSLTISAIYLGSLPHSLGNLTNLESLTLILPSLTHLPNFFGNLQNLKILTIKNSRLNSLADQPQNFSLKSLERCILEDMASESLPVFLRGLPRLHTLTITSQRYAQGTARSPLCTLPLWINELPALRKLIITNHPYLKTLPDSLGYLPRLEFLDLSSNGLIALPPELTNLPHLVKLDVSENRLEHIPHEFKFWDRLKYFRFHNNPLRSLSGIPRANRYAILHRFGPLPEKYSTPYPQEYERCFNYEHLTEPMHHPDYPKIDQLRVPQSIIDGVTPPHFDNNDIVLEALFNREEAHDQGLEYWDSYLEKGWDQLGFVMLLDYYDKTPQELTMQYIQDPASLTPEEVDRLKYEGNFRERALLELQMPPDDPILMAISARYEVLPDHPKKQKNSSNFTLLL